MWNNKYIRVKNYFAEISKILLNTDIKVILFETQTDC